MGRDCSGGLAVGGGYNQKLVADLTGDTMLTIEQENKIKCILSECGTCDCKTALEQIFHCQLLNECEYESLLRSCWDSYLAIEANKKYRREYPDGA